MGNTYFNIRFGKWHWQVLRDKPWVRISRNDYWDYHPMTQWLEVYCWFGKYY